MAARFSVLQGGGEAPDIHPRRYMLSVAREWGEHKVCGACAFRWHARGIATPCPNCKADIHWVEAHWTPEKAEARADEIDVAEVAAIRAQVAREWAKRVPAA